VYDPADRSTSVLLEDLYYANGVALSRDEDFVLVAETTRCRFARFWLKGKADEIADHFAAGPGEGSTNGYLIDTPPRRRLPGA
jgi:sugar lactone lactonase YvrE